jgi:hypothetical protein
MGMLLDFAHFIYTYVCSDPTFVNYAFFEPNSVDNLNYLCFEFMNR